MATQILSIHLSPLLSAAAASSLCPPPSWSLSSVPDEKLADNYCPYTKILIKVQMWCGNQNLCCYEINTLENTRSNSEDAQTWKQPRPKPAITQAASSGNLVATRPKWRRFHRRHGETVAGGKRREPLLSFITKHREETLGWYWRHQSGFQQQLIIRKQVKKKALCSITKDIYPNVGGKFMLKVSFLIKK